MCLLENSFVRDKVYFEYSKELPIIDVYPFLILLNSIGFSKKNDKKLQAIFPGFSLFFHRELNINPSKSVWYLILSYFMNWNKENALWEEIKKIYFHCT